MRTLLTPRRTVAALVAGAVLLTSAGPALAHDGTDHEAADPDAAPTTTVVDDAGAGDGEDGGAEATAPTTTVAPAAPATTDGATAADTKGKADKRDPRWRNYKCRRGINACQMAKYHQQHGHFQGEPGHRWSDYRRQARQLRSYIKKLVQAKQRRALVQRWSGVARCESGGNWRASSGNGYYGGLQFNLGTWRAYGGRGYPHHQPAWEQATVAERVRTRSGLHHWPHCGRYFG